MKQRPAFADIVTFVEVALQRPTPVMVTLPPAFFTPARFLKIVVAIVRLMRNCIFVRTNLMPKLTFAFAVAITTVWLPNEMSFGSGTCPLYVPFAETVNRCSKRGVDIKTISPVSEPGKPYARAATRPLSKQGKPSRRDA